MLPRIANNERLLVPLLSVAGALLFLGSFVAPPSGEYLGGDDVVWQLLQSWRLARAQLSVGRLPLWNPYLFSGVPLLANPQPGFLYPPNWILFLTRLPLNSGLAWLSAFHLAWAYAGMYVWARGEHMRPAAASLAAISLAFSGFMAVRVADGHPNFVATLSWTPWAMAAVRKMITRPTLARAALVGATFAMSFLAGNPAGVVLVIGLPVLLLSAELAWPNRAAPDWRIAGAVVLALAFAAGFAAVQLLPTVELILRSARAAQADVQFASEFALPVPHLVSLLVPNFFGEPVRTGYWGEGRHTEFILYPGLAALTLAAVAVRQRWSDPRVRFWAVVAIGGLLLALGPAGGLHPLLVRILPPLRWIRAPARFGFWSIFALSALAGFALDDARLRSSARMRNALVGAAALLAAGAIVAMAAFRAGVTPHPDRLYHIGAAMLRSALILSLGGAVFAWAQSRRPHAGAFAAAMLVITLVDLFGYGIPLLRLTREDYDATWRAAASHLESDDRVLPWGLFLFFQNGGMNHGVASVFGYDPLIPAAYEAFTGSVPDPRARTFDLLNARYLLAHRDQQFGAEARPVLVAELGEFAVFERTRYLPRAWAVADFAAAPAAEHAAIINSPGFDPRAIALTERNPDCGTTGEAEVVVEVLTTQPGAIELSVNATAPAILVLSEQYYPGWQVSVGSARQNPFLVNGVLQGVCIAAGSHSVRFEFAPGIVVWGVLVTLTTLIVTAALGLRRQVTGT